MMKSTIFWIHGPWKGRLAIVPRPRGGDWLEDELRFLHSAGISVIVSTLTEEEVAELELADETALCRAESIEFVEFPIEDRSVPDSMQATAAFVRLLENKLADGKDVAIHCRQGVGRSALLASAVLTASGIDVETAFQRVATARGCPVPDTLEQKEWVAKFARNQLNRVSPS